MVLFAIVKTLVRFLAVALSVFISLLLALVALWVAYRYVQAETLLSAPPFYLFPVILEGLSTALIPAVFGMVLSMIVYYGRHRMSAIGSRIVLFVLAGAALYGGMLIVSYQRVGGFSPSGSAPGLTRVSGIQLARRPGAILDYGASALVAFDGALVEASKERELAFLPLTATATVELPGEPQSVFTEMLKAGEPLDGLLAETLIIRDHFERLAASSLVDYAFCAFSLVLLLISFQGLGVMSAWPLANALMTVLILRLALAALAFFYSDPRVLELFSRFLPGLPPLWGPPVIITALALAFMAMNALLAVLRRPTHG